MSSGTSEKAEANGDGGSCEVGSSRSNSEYACRVRPPFQVDRFTKALTLGEGVGSADADPPRVWEGDRAIVGAAGAYISESMLSSRGDVRGENSCRTLSDWMATESQAAIRAARNGSDAGVATWLDEQDVRIS